MGESVRVGIDVGGTNTDAVAIDDTGVVVARVKEPTTADPTEGIVAALHTVAANRTVDRVALGTTHAVNAINRAVDAGRDDSGVQHGIYR